MNYVACFVLLCSAQNIVADSCTTPDKEPGVCVELHRCPSLIQLFSNSTKEILPFFKEHTCDGSDSQYFVCCPNSTISTYLPNKLSDRRYCGYQHSDDYYAEKQESTSIDEFPWLVAIHGRFNTSKIDRINCEGSLINTRYVLSVAHCFLPFGNIHFIPKKIVLGEYHVNNKTDCVDLPQFGTRDCSDVEEYGIEEIITHPLYDSFTGLHDISLIRLDRKVTFSDYIRPICLPTSSTFGAKVGDTLYTTGWGKKTHQTATADVKKKISSTWVSNQECDQVLERLQSNLRITDYRICSRDYKNGTEFSCLGDSGASLMYNYNNQWFLEGMVAQGTPCGPDALNMNTRVSKYLEWISYNMRV